MLGLILRRLLIAIPTMLVIIAVTFFMMRSAPGSPFQGERALPKEIELRVKEHFGLNKPWNEQFVDYVVGLTTRFDMGPSMKYKDKDVQQIIAEGFPTSATIGGLSIVIAIFVGGLLGVMAALRQNRPQDYVVMGIALIGVCVPPLVMGPLMALLFGVTLQWTPTAGLYRDQFTLQHLLLPVLTLSLPQIAIVSRLMRSSMIEAMKSNAIRTARAKGLPEHQVIWRHALPVASLPIVSYLGPALAGVMAGSFVIESVFGLPGIGTNFVRGAEQRDYTLVMGVVLLYAGLVILFNLVADVLYGVLDPKARSGTR
jgi:oligopeptide transport system permease protein